MIYYEIIFFLDKPSPPLAPLDISDITPETCTLTWKPPFDDGGSPITNYIVEKLDPAGVSLIERIYKQHHQRNNFLFRYKMSILSNKHILRCSFESLLVLGEAQQLRKEHALRRDRPGAKSHVQLPRKSGESVRSVRSASGWRADNSQVPLHGAGSTWTAACHRLGHLERDGGLDKTTVRWWISHSSVYIIDIQGKNRRYLFEILRIIL